MRQLSVVLVSIAVLLTGCGSDQRSNQLALFEELSSYPVSLSCLQEDPSRAVENPFVSEKNDAEPDASWLPLIGNPYGRSHVSLNGYWQYIVDQLDVGDRGMTMRGGVGQGRDAGVRELLEYGFDDNQSMSIPGDWNTTAKGLDWYRGVVWFKKDFNHSVSLNQRTLLYFGGAYIQKDIYLNGELIAKHHSGFTAFNIDVTDKLRQGTNRLVVKVDSRSGPFS